MLRVAPLNAALDRRVQDRGQFWWEASVTILEENLFQVRFGEYDFGSKGRLPRAEHGGEMPFFLGGFRRPRRLRRFPRLTYVVWGLEKAACDKPCFRQHHGYPT